MTDTPPDNLQPNNQFVGPDGKITGLFSGGVVLEEAGASTPVAGDSIQWTSDGTPTGALREWIQGIKVGTAHFLELYSNPDGNDVAQIQLQAEEGGGAGSAIVSIVVLDDTGASWVTTLLDSLGRMILPDGGNIVLGTVTGTKIGTADNQQLAFYGKAPTAQPSSSGSNAFTNGTGAAVQSGFSSAGNIGATKYTFSDLVQHLKELGLIAS